MSRQPSTRCAGCRKPQLTDSFNKIEGPGGGGLRSLLVAGARGGVRRRIPFLKRWERNGRTWVFGHGDALKVFVRPQAALRQQRRELDSQGGA